MKKYLFLIPILFSLSLSAQWNVTGNTVTISPAPANDSTFHLEAPSAAAIQSGQGRWVADEAGSFEFGSATEGTDKFTEDRYINLDGNSIMYAADDRVAANSVGGGIINQLLDPQSGSVLSWNDIVGTFDNAGSTTNNFVYTRGFNLDETGGRIDPTKPGWGESWEFHYEPSAGDIFIEKHIIYVDVSDVQHRLESYTIDLDESVPWEQYHKLSKWYIKDPTNDGQYLSVQRSGTTASSLFLTGSASEDGAQFSVDVAATNLQIQPSGLTGTSKNLIMNTWDNVDLTAFTSYVTGGTYANRARQNLVGWGDNDTTLGIQGFRFSDIEGCALKITAPGNYSTKYFEVTDAGAVLAPNIPTHADEAAAVTAGLATGTIYKTETGELRIKL